MSKRFSRWDPADVIGRVILAALVAAIVVGVLQTVVAFAEIALEAPLFAAGYLALVGVVALPYRFAARAWRARRPRLGRPRWTRPRPRLWPSWVPKDITDGLTLAGCGVFFGGGGVLLVADGLDHGFGGFTSVVMGSLGALFGVACVAGCVRHFRTREQRRLTIRMESTRDLVRRYAVRTGRHDVEGLRELLRALADPRIAGPVALAELSDCPGLLDGLSHHGRRGDLASELRPFVDVTTATERPPESGLAAALASLDRDGHAREAAVVVMAAEPSPANAWFLAERAVDPVEPVRVRALAALRALVAVDPETYAPVVREAATRPAGGGPRRSPGRVRCGRLNHDRQYSTRPARQARIKGLARRG